MEHTAGPILEIGVLLLAAVLAGWIARRIGLPAVVGYLGLGIVVSPFTPGYVADHEQLQLLADLGVVLLLFEVGIEVDLLRIRSSSAGCSLAAPIQVVVTTLASAARPRGARPRAAAGRADRAVVALSSSVVIVNITRSRRRTTDRPTEDALLGWSAIQDSTGVVIAAVLLALLGDRRAAARPGGHRADRVPRPRGRGRPAPPDRAESPPRRARPVPDHVGRERPCPGRPRLARVRRPARARGVRRRPRGHRERGGGGGPPPPAPLPRPVRGPVLRRDRNPDRARGAGPGLGWLAVFLVLIVVTKVLVAWILARSFRLPARPGRSPSDSARSGSSRSSSAPRRSPRARSPATSMSRSSPRSRSASGSAPWRSASSRAHQGRSRIRLPRAEIAKELKHP